MKKFFSFLVAILMSVTLVAGCGKKDDSSGCGDMTLDQLNEMLNDKENMNMDFANPVAIIPFNHINGPRNEWKFYALINFQYAEKRYVKYQVTYLSCTCRTANVNYWQTAYIELTSNVDNPENSKLRALSFDIDGTGHYTAGFWGDSDPIISESTGKTIATYDEYIEATENIAKVKIDKKTYVLSVDENNKVVTLTMGDNKYEVTNDTVSINDKTYTINYSGNNPTTLTEGANTYEIFEEHAGILMENDQGVEGYYYPTIKNEFIADLLIGKTKAQIDSYNTMDDMVKTDANANNPMSEDLYDSFTGASVSTNNILRILHAVFKYHAETWWTTETAE